MNKYLTSFRLLTHLGVSNIRATGVLKKIGYSNALPFGANSCKKKEPGHSERLSTHQGKKAV